MNTAILKGDYDEKQGEAFDPFKSRCGQKFTTKDKRNQHETVCTTCKHS